MDHLYLIVQYHIIRALDYFLQKYLQNIQIQIIDMSMISVFITVFMSSNIKYSNTAYQLNKTNQAAIFEKYDITANQFYMNLLKKVFHNSIKQVSEYFDAVSIYFNQSQKSFDQNSIQSQKSSLKQYIKDIEKALLETISPSNAETIQRQRQLQKMQIQYQSLSIYLQKAIQAQVAQVQPSLKNKTGGLIELLDLYIQKQKKKEQQSLVLIKKLERELLQKNRRNSFNFSIPKREQNPHQHTNIDESNSIQFILDTESPNSVENQLEILKTENQILRRKNQILVLKKSEMDATIAFMKSQKRDLSQKARSNQKSHARQIVKEFAEQSQRQKSWKEIGSLTKRTQKSIESIEKLRQIQIKPFLFAANPNSMRDKESVNQIEDGTNRKIYEQKKLAEFQLRAINQERVIKQLQSQLSAIKQNTQEKYEQIVRQIKNSHQQQVFLLQKQLQLQLQQIETLRKNLSQLQEEKQNIKALIQTQEKIQVSKMLNYANNLKKALENICQKANFKIQELNNQIRQLQSQIQLYGIKIGQILFLVDKKSQSFEYPSDSKKLQRTVQLLKDIFNNINPTLQYQDFQVKYVNQTQEGKTKTQKQENSMFVNFKTKSQQVQYAQQTQKYKSPINFIHQNKLEKQAKNPLSGEFKSHSRFFQKQKNNKTKKIVQFLNKNKNKSFQIFNGTQNSNMSNNNCNVQYFARNQNEENKNAQQLQKANKSIAYCQLSHFRIQSFKKSMNKDCYFQSQLRSLFDREEIEESAQDNPQFKRRSTNKFSDKITSPFDSHIQSLTPIIQQFLDEGYNASINNSGFDSAFALLKQQKENQRRQD